MEFYYELTIEPNKYYELFLDLLGSLSEEAIEEDGSKMILRSYENPQDIVDGIEEFTMQLKSHLESDIDCKIECKKLRNEDWIAKYKNSIEPIDVGNFYVRPTWRESKRDKVEIIIDPALAFGSGHHETTSSCLKLLEKYTKSGNTVLDVGCGSGILAIGASKLGAICDICDTDLLAVQNAVENFELNGVKVSKFWEGSANNATEKYDIVVANIVADVLVFIHNDLKKCLKKDGVLILSGILDIHKDKVLKKFINYEKLDEVILNEWYSVVLRSQNLELGENNG